MIRNQGCANEKKTRTSFKVHHKRTKKQIIDITAYMMAIQLKTSQTIPLFAPRTGKTSHHEIAGVRAKSLEYIRHDIETFYVTGH